MLSIHNYKHSKNISYQKLKYLQNAISEKRQ